MKSDLAVLGCKWLGDNIMAIPTVRNLTETRDNTVWLLPSSQSDLIQKGSGLETAPFEKTFRRRIGQLSAFRSVFILPNSFRSALETFLAGIPERIGYSTDGRGFLLTDTERKDASGHQVSDYLPLLKRFGAHRDLPQPLLDIKPAAPPTPVGLYAGWSNTPTKAWPAGKWADLALRLKSEGIGTTLLAGPGEEEKVREIIRLAGIDLPIVGPDLSLREMATFLAGFDVVAGNDTGPLHLSAACGTRTIVIFGPTDPKRTCPTGDHVRAVYSYTSCSPCFKNTCPYEHQCMQAIPAWEVARLIKTWIQG